MFMGFSGSCYREPEDGAAMQHSLEYAVPIASLLAVRCLPIDKAGSDLVSLCDKLLGLNKLGGQCYRSCSTPFIVDQPTSYAPF